MPSAWPGRHLPAVDTEHAGAQHLGDERRLVAGQRKVGGQHRRQLDPDMRQRVVGEHHLQDQRRAAEDHGVGPGDRRQQPEAGELHAGEDQSKDQSAAEPEGSHLEGELDALEQIRHAQVMEE
ncbi:hypothetical protein ACVWZL_003343 [Bradyrhizobium sp. GM2.4]